MIVLMPQLLTSQSCHERIPKPNTTDLINTRLSYNRLSYRDSSEVKGGGDFYNKFSLVASWLL